MRIIFDKAVIAKVNVSPSNAARVYITVVDIDAGGSSFEFSSDTMAYADVLGQVGQMTHLEGKFETYPYTDRNGIARTGWKCSNLVSKPISSK